MEQYQIFVYKIYWSDCDEFYIGSTKLRLSKRMIQHRSACRKGNKYKLYQFMREKGVNSFEYMLVSTHQVISIDEQRKYEQEKIAELKPTLNTYRAFVTDEELLVQKKEYYLNNKEELLARGKEYRQNNKEKAKEYYSKNKERILAKKKEYRQNNKENIASREKEYRHNNKEKAKEYQKEYYLNNKERITARREEYRQNNKEKIASREKEYRQNNKEKIAAQGKEKITCECGAVFKKDNKYNHKKTKKHIFYTSIHEFIYS